MYRVHNKLWWSTYSIKSPKHHLAQRGADAAQTRVLVEGMNQQLEGFEGVALCLQSGDQLLYDIFKDDFFFVRGSLY